jgi:hypothetical protein
MHCSIDSKVMLIRAALERYEGYTPAAQRSLGEGIFWLCDGMMEQTTDNQTDAYFRSNLLCLKSMSNEMVKRTLSADEIFEAKAYCAKLTKHPGDQDIP